METWDRVRDERIALAATLAELDGAAWSAPSLCTQWTVRGVANHVLAGAVRPQRITVLDTVWSGFSLNRGIVRSAARYGAMSNSATVDAIRASAGSRRVPAPGLRDRDLLADTIVHHEDIRRPLGLPTLAYDGDSVRLALDGMARMQMVLGNRRRIARLRLEADDLDWTHGDGPVARGPASSLLLAMCGRPAGLGALTGPGVRSLAERMGASLAPARSVGDGGGHPTSVEAVGDAG